MNTITIDRATVEQALGAMNEAVFSLYSPYTSETPEEKALYETIAAFRAALAQQAEAETCTWQQDGDSESGLYATSCRRYFSLDDGTPEDNRLAWCCYCGKRLVQELITEEDGNG